MADLIFNSLKGEAESTNNLLGRKSLIMKLRNMKTMQKVPPKEYCQIIL